MAGKRDLEERIRLGVSGFLRGGEQVLELAEVMKGPRTLIASLLTPIGFFLLERPRNLVLTPARLLVTVPPARGGGETKLEAALDRSDIRVAGWEPSRLWTRLVLEHPGGRLGVNFARVWRDEALAIRSALD